MGGERAEDDGSELKIARGKSALVLKLLPTATNPSDGASRWRCCWRRCPRRGRWRQRRGYQGRRAMSLAALTEPETALEIARGGGGFVWLECAQGSIAVTPCAHASHEGQVHTHSPPLRRHSASLNYSELARRRWFYEKNATINHVIASKCGAYKKSTKRQPSVHVLLNSMCTDGRQFSD